MIKNLSYLLLIAGLGLGPAYWIYAKFFTGTQALLLTLDRTAAGGGTWRSAEFSLDPSMAPVGLILHGQGSFAGNLRDGKPPKDRYTATLYRNGEAATPLTFFLNPGNAANATFKEHLVFLQAVQAGSYRLEAAAAGVPEIRLDRLQLEVRQNLHEPDNRTVTAGVVVLILGILGLVAI